MTQVVIVAPVPGGWSVQSEMANPLVFASGGHAESAAKRIAQAIAKTGKPARIEVFLDGGALAGIYSLTPNASE